MDQPNRYAAPKAEVRDVVDTPQLNIDELAVSATWKRRFHLIETAGGVRLVRLKELPFGDRMRVSFNVLAFLFGPLYYLAKGLWRKAITFLIVAVIIVASLSIVLNNATFDVVDRALGYGLAAIFATRANIDYYKRMVLKDNGWW